MESIGQKLRESREAKGITIEQAARDTHISRKYLVGLEEEDFTAFPGEPYVTGFLRNYADYLGLPAQDLLSSYRNLKIQEQPAPMKELIAPQGLSPVLIVGMVMGVVALVALAVLLTRGQPESTLAPQRPVAHASAAPGVIEMRDEFLEQPFAAGEVVKVMVRDVQVEIAIVSIAEVVQIRLPSGVVDLAPGAESRSDLSGDGNADLRIQIKQIIPGEPVKAVIRLDKSVQSPGAAAQPQTVEPVLETAAQGSTVLVPNAEAKKPFILEVEFRQNVMLRSVVDRRGREEQYFKKGQFYRVDVNDEVRLWYSNAGAMLVRVAGVQLELGKEGEVGSILLRWAKDQATGRYRLESVPVP